MDTNSIYRFLSGFFVAETGEGKRQPKEGDLNPYSITAWSILELGEEYRAFLTSLAVGSLKGKGPLPDADIQERAAKIGELVRQWAELAARSNASEWGDGVHNHIQVAKATAWCCWADWQVLCIFSAGLEALSFLLHKVVVLRDEPQEVKPLWERYLKDVQRLQGTKDGEDVERDSLSLQGLQAAVLRGALMLAADDELRKAFTIITSDSDVLTNIAEDSVQASHHRRLYGWW